MLTLGPYRQSVPGWGASGIFASVSIIACSGCFVSGRLTFAYPALTSKPAVWLINCRIVIGVVCGTLPEGVATLRPANSGMYFDTGSSSVHLPCSHSIIMATPTMGLVIDARRKIVSWTTGFFVARS